MNTLTTAVDDFIKFLSPFDEEIEIDEWFSQPLNTKKAKENKIIKTEQKLDCGFPEELKSYYLNEANGTEETDKYALDEQRLEIFSHQRVIGVIDYFSLYWEEEMDENPFEYHMGCLVKLSEKEKLFIIQKNKEYFVCAVHWSENFLETFVFDKNNNFYRFNFDQDDSAIEYINEIEEGSENIEKDKSLIKLFVKYIREKKEELKEDMVD